ncbi:MAG TPA: hypothetical protein VHZ95_17795, partial [Polyangiales bacterium]|nr:hypothetical protein [Polyangiales bacterium]
MSYAAAACKVWNSTCKPDDRSCLNGGLLRSGQPCVRTGDCATGLRCDKSVCSYAGTTKSGDACIVSRECGDGLYCSIGLQCTPLDDDAQAMGGPCATSADCQQGLVCDIDVGKLFSQGPYGLLSSDCQNQLLSSNTPDECELPKVCTARGDGELGSDCQTNADCLAGLYCEENPLDRSGTELCVGGVKLTVEPVTIPRWDGVSCPADETSATAYFEVPRSGKSIDDFYRLPFPNDIRRRDGMIDMSGHPAPPDSLQPPAAVRFIAAAAKTDGFATNPVVFFRFSEPIDSTTLTGDTLRIVDITKTSAEYGLPSSIAWSPTERTSHYICPHWIGIHRLIGAPLQPGDTYAAIISKGVVAKSGAKYARDADLD